MGPRVPVVVAVLGLLAPGRAAGATPGDAIRTAVAARLAVPAADVEVYDLGLPADAPADADFRVKLPSYPLRSGHLPVTLEVLDGPAAGRWAVRPALRLYAALPVALRPAAPGEPILLGSARMAVEALRGAEPVDPALAWEARVGIEAGQPVTASTARLVPDVRGGAVLPAVVRRGALEVRCDARLQDDARFGDTVRVVSLSTNARLAGVLQADGTVLLGGS
jgi:hypothetical protein